MREKMYQGVIIVLLILFAVFVVETDKNYNDLLDVNDDLLKLIDENRTVYNNNLESQRETIDELHLEIFKQQQYIEELEKKNEDLMYYPYTEEELETFAHLLYAEAGGSSDLGIIYVGSVVLNRVSSDKFPNTLLEVIYQDGQYSPTWHGFMNVEVENESCYRIAKYLLENGSVIPSEVLGQADYTIYKKYGSELYDEVDGNYFFYLKGEE